MSDQLTLIKTDWHTSQKPLSYIRTKVFIEEQQVPVELEWDEDDKTAIHLLARIGESPIGCARILVNKDQLTAKVGRMAVLPEHRYQGIGDALLQRCIALAKELHLSQITLSAQCYAIPFYEKAGFIAHGEIYLDAGIEHRDMRLTLN